MSYRVVLVDIASGQVMGQTSVIANKNDAEISCKRNNSALNNMALEYRVIEAEPPVPFGGKVTPMCDAETFGGHRWSRDSTCIKCGIHSSEEFE